MTQKVVIGCATGQAEFVDMTPVEQASYAAQQQAATQTQEAQRQAATQRATDAATLLNAATVRDTQEHRDAFARLIGVQPLTIPLTQDATALDIVLL